MLTQQSRGCIDTRYIHMYTYMCIHVYIYTFPTYVLLAREKQRSDPPYIEVRFVKTNGHLSRKSSRQRHKEEGKMENGRGKMCSFSPIGCAAESRLKPKKDSFRSSLRPRGLEIHVTLQLNESAMRVRSAESPGTLTPTHDEPMTVSTPTRP